MSICNYLVQRSKQIKRYHDWTDLLLVTLFLRTIADCSTADFLFFVLPFLFAVLPSFFPSAVFTNSAQRLWTVFPKCRDWRSMSPCITSSLFSGCSNLEDRAAYWKLWLRQAHKSLPRSCFLGCHATSQRCVTSQKMAVRETKTNSTGDVSYSEGQRVTQNVKHGITWKARNRAKQGVRNHVRGTGSSDARDEESCERHARGQVKRGGWNI